jgi:hypothetical protein
VCGNKYITEANMEIAEIRYPNERTIEITGELDIDMKAESIHLGCYSEKDNAEDWRECAHVDLTAYPHIKLKDLEALFRWVSKNTGYRSMPVEDSSGEIVKMPRESNWRLTLERID